MSNPYGEVIADHFHHPRNFGSLPAADVRHEGFNPLCGDRVRFELLIVDGHVAQARFQGDLCMIAKAASSLLTELITGKRLESALSFDEQHLLEALQADIRPARLQCVRLPLDTLRAALAR